MSANSITIPQLRHLCPDPEWKEKEGLNKHLGEDATSLSLLLLALALGKSPEGLKRCHSRRGWWKWSAQLEIDRGSVTLLQADTETETNTLRFCSKHCCQVPSENKGAGRAHTHARLSHVYLRAWGDYKTQVSPHAHRLLFLKSTGLSPVCHLDK